MRIAGIIAEWSSGSLLVINRRTHKEVRIPPPLQKTVNSNNMEEINIVNKNADDLITPSYNPRKISAKQKEGIRKSIETFGLVQPLVVNVNPERMNVVIGGNQRLAILKSLGYDVIPCIEVNLDEEKEKELNLRLNKNQAEFDFDALKEFFDDTMLFDVGFSEKEVGKILDEYEKKFDEMDNTKCVMPIVQKFNEKYNTVMIFCNNELDFNWLRNVLRLERKKDYSNSRIGEALVMTVQDFQKIWEEATENGED